MHCFIESSSAASFGQGAGSGPGTQELGGGVKGGERGAGSWQSDSLLPAPSSLLLRQAAEVVDQAQPQHAAHRPQFRQRQRRHGLVGAEKMLQTLLVELRIEMGDQFPRQAVDARQTFAAHVEKARQLAESPIAEIPPRRSHQLPKPAEVVNQPRAGGRDRALLGRRPPKRSNASCKTRRLSSSRASSGLRPWRSASRCESASSIASWASGSGQLQCTPKLRTMARRKVAVATATDRLVRRMAWGLPRPQWALGVSGGQGSHWGGLQSIRLRQSVGWGRASEDPPPFQISWWAGTALAGPTLRLSLRSKASAIVAAAGAGFCGPGSGSSCHPDR